MIGRRPSFARLSIRPWPISPLAPVISTTGLRTKCRLLFFDSRGTGAYTPRSTAARSTLSPRTVTAKLGALLSPILDALVRALAHVSADVLTMTGLALTGVASAFFALSGGPGYASPALCAWAA